MPEFKQIGAFSAPKFSWQMTGHSSRDRSVTTTKKGDEFRIQMKKGAYLITVREISEINLILPVGVGGVEANNDNSPQSV
jgi:hypothetical protein